MAELFMECEEEELEPWQQRSTPIVVDDDDDDEPIFVGEILSSKPASTYILNRVNPNSSRTGLQNGVLKTGFQSATRPATSTLAVQPQPRVSGLSGTAQALQRAPLSGGPSSQEAAKMISGLSQSAGRGSTTTSLTRNLGIPVLAQSAFRPVATVTAQPATFNRGHTPGLAFGSGGPPCLSGSPVNAAGLSKRPSTSEGNSTSPKKAKADELGPGGDSLVLLSNDTSLLQKGAASTNPFPQACPKCNIHFNLSEPLKNHIKYCCPEMLSAFLGGLQPDSSGGMSAKMIEAESGKLIMLVNDFYYGKHEGNLQQVCQEQKTHTTFKCASCMKLLKSNIRFMNHMKHHLELEKQNSESWESHTTCQHCYRQFPTPFQLQCHIESTHTPHECSTICKICELSFETEQVLLQHMKDNHKPGEMPYVCQVCSYRSSAFSDVEKHFRTVHENTKSLLCPFCLKVIKIGAPYMHHFMRHQKKGVHRCTKCRLQFLTSKEKLEHKSQHHRTFKKPAQLEGLPPGTKVTIRASVGSLPPAALTTSPVNAQTFPLQTSPVDKVTNTKSYNKASASKAKSKPKPLSLQKKQSASNSASSSASSSASKKHEKVANTALHSLRCLGIQKCIECNSDIRTFASHFPTYVCCSLCRYKTSCSKAYANHMLSFHSARQNKRFGIYRSRSDALRGMTAVCLDCDFLSDDSALDNMAAHLNDNDDHTSHIITESGPGSLNSFTADDVADQPNKVLFTSESDEKPPVASTSPVISEDQEGPSGPQSSQAEAVAEADKEELVGKQRDEAALWTGRDGNRPPVEGACLAPLPRVFAVETPVVLVVEEKPALTLGVEGSAGASAAEAQEEPVPGIESVPGAGGGGQGSSPPEGVEEGGGDGNREAEMDCLGRRQPLLIMANAPSLLEPGSCSRDSAGGGVAEALAGQGKGPPPEAGAGGQASSSSSGSGWPSFSGEPGGAPLVGQSPGSLEAGGEGEEACPGGPSCAGLSASGACSEEGPHDSGQEDPPDSPATLEGAELASESLGSATASPPAPERDSPVTLSLGCGEPGEPMAEEEEEEGRERQGGGCLSPPPAGEEGRPPPSVPGLASSPLSSPGSSGEALGLTKGTGQGSRGPGLAAVAADSCLESSPGSTPAESLPSGTSEASLPGPLEETPLRPPPESPGGGGGSAEEKEQLQRSLAKCTEVALGTPPGDPAGEGEGAPCGPGGQVEAVSSPEPAMEEEAEEAQVEGEAAAPQDIELAEGEDTDGPLGTEREVSGFEQFLSMRGESSLANSEGSDQGSCSAQLEPLTPSDLLEHEATEILQKGGGGRASAVGGSGTESEHTEGVPSSGQGSPGPEAASTSGGPTEEEDKETSGTRWQQQQQP